MPLLPLAINLKQGAEKKQHFLLKKSLVHEIEILACRALSRRTSIHCIIPAPPLTLLYLYYHSTVITFSQHCHNILTALSQYSHSIATTFSQHCHNIILTTLSQYSHSTVTIFSQHCQYSHSTVTVFSQHCHNILTALS